MVDWERRKLAFHKQRCDFADSSNEPHRRSFKGLLRGSEQWTSPSCSYMSFRESPNGSFRSASPPSSFKYLNLSRRDLIKALSRKSTTQKHLRLLSRYNAASFCQIRTGFGTWEGEVSFAAGTLTIKDVLCVEGHLVEAVKILDSKLLDLPTWLGGGNLPGLLALEFCGQEDEICNLKCLPERVGACGSLRHLDLR